MLATFPRRRTKAVSDQRGQPSDSADQPLLHQGLQALEHLGLLQLLKGQPRLIAHGGIAVMKKGVDQCLHHRLLAGLHQIAIETPQ